MPMHPAQSLLYASGLILFWLMPLIAWTLLKGQRDTAARCWFLGTASYAIVAVLFVAQGPTGHWLQTGALSAFSTLMVLLLMESMRIELHPGPVRWMLVVVVVSVDAVVMTVVQGEFGPIVARVVQLSVISVLDLWLVVLLLRVIRLHRSRALFYVVCVALCVIATNLARVYRYWAYDEPGGLGDFTVTTNLAFLANYLSVVFYSFGYWGFVIEKSRNALLRAVEEAGLARTGESRALDRERQSLDLLRERDELIARLGAMQRIVHFGALSASIAHEINQPLASTRLCAQEALANLRGGGPPARTDEMLRRTVRENERAAGIVQTLRDLFKGRHAATERRNLDVIVEAIVRLMQQRATEDGVTITVQARAPECVPTGAGELEHVLLNLLSNAIDALRTLPLGLDRRVELRTLVDADHLVVWIGDSGPGIPQSQRERLFDLVQSSKADGLGLGLWLSRFIVERHGGAIEYVDEDERDRVFHAVLGGACFRIRLPRIEAATRAPG